MKKQLKSWPIILTRWQKFLWYHDDVIKWKHFPRNWLFVRRMHRSPVNSPHKGQWRGALMFSLICVWINCWVNNREAGDLWRNRGHYDVTVMCNLFFPDLNFSAVKLKPVWYYELSHMAVRMMMSWNGNIFRLTGRSFMVGIHQSPVDSLRIPFTNVGDAELWYMLEQNAPNSRKAGEFKCLDTHLTSL